MASSSAAAMDLRWGLRWLKAGERMTTSVALAAATLLAIAIALVLSASAQAHHRPPHIGVDPQPALGVPDPVLVTPSGLGGLRLPLPPTLPDEPDLIPIMPTESALTGANVPALFVDTVEIPGRVLYRFDAVLGNIGGAFDLYCQQCATPGQALFQAVWAGGRPPGPQSGFSTPGGDFDAVDLTARGGYMVYSPLGGHNHWHYDVAATYELLIPGGASIPTVKIGFCMLDTYDTISNFNYYNAFQPWCMSGNPAAPFVRMGISPGVGDYYNAQLADQWIDVTGVDPGTYALRAEVNPPRVDLNPSAPPRIIVESNTTNNVGDFDNVIPGGKAAAVAASTAAGQPVAAALSGTLVGADVKSRISTCTSGGSLYDFFCYEDASGDTSLTFAISQAPANGTLGTVSTSSDTTATVTYTPNPGFVGTDTFTYTTTDSRGLAGNPATVTITVGTGPANAVAPTLTGSTNVDEMLSATAGIWTGDAPLTYAYQWQRCDTGAPTASTFPAPSR